MRALAARGPSHRFVKAPIALVWDRLNTVEGGAGQTQPGQPRRAHLAVLALDRLEALVRNWLKRLQYRPGTLDGFMTGTGLTLDAPASPRRAEANKEHDRLARRHLLRLPAL